MSNFLTKALLDERKPSGHVDKQVELTDASGEKTEYTVKILKLNANQVGRHDVYHLFGNDKQREMKAASIKSRLVALCLCDSDGQLIAKQAKEGAEFFGMLSPHDIEALYAVCREVNPNDFSDAKEKEKAEKEEDDIEEDVKNS